MRQGVKPVVCDASILVAFILPDELSSAADALVAEAQREQTTLLTAAHAALELGEALNRAQRRGRISAEVLETALAILEALPLHYLPLDLTTREVSVVAAREELSCYDAAYLLLAHRVGGHLATADAALAAAARRSGVLWDFSAPA